jgi:hypothetical protein
MKVVKQARINAGPIVDRHGFLLETAVMAPPLPIITARQRVDGGKPPLYGVLADRPNVEQEIDL